MIKRIGVLLAVVLLLPIALASPASGAVRARTINIGSATFEYCGNHSLNAANATIETVVVVIHGTGRNACDYGSFVETSANQAGRSTTTLIVAPHFYASSDSRPSSRLLFWTSDGWKDGAVSLNGGGLSSYTVIDTILQRANDKARFPNVTRIVVAGHSAGGCSPTGTRLAPGPASPHGMSWRTPRATSTSPRNGGGPAPYGR